MSMSTNEVAGLPAEQVTSIIALIDEGKLAEAELKLKQLTAYRMASLVGQRLRGHDSELEKLAAQTAAHEVRLAVLEAKPSTAGPINEAGITATFAAIFAALDSLLDRVATLESARIAAPTAPESAETAGSATEAHSGCDRCPPTGLCYWCSCRKADELIDAAHADAAEVAAALRMYRKVQRLQACDDIFGFGVKMDTFLHFQYAAPLLAWLKEGEAQ